MLNRPTVICEIAKLIRLTGCFANFTVIMIVDVRVMGNVSKNIDGNRKPMVEQSNARTTEQIS